MKSIKRRFLGQIDKRPDWSTNTCFAMAVDEQGFIRETIARWFNVLVSKDDYDKKDKNAILKHLLGLTYSKPNKIEKAGFRIVYNDRCHDPDMD